LKNTQQKRKYCSIGNIHTNTCIQSSNKFTFYIFIQNMMSGSKCDIICEKGGLLRGKYGCINPLSDA